MNDDDLDLFRKAHADFYRLASSGLAMRVEAFWLIVQATTLGLNTDRQELEPVARSEHDAVTDEIEGSFMVM